MRFVEINLKITKFQELNTPSDFDIVLYIAYYRIKDLIRKRFVGLTYIKCLHLCSLGLNT